MVLRSADPEGSARALVEMGFEPDEDETTVAAGDYKLRLVSPPASEDGEPMLFHLGCLVDSAEEHREEAERKGLEIQDWVEGPNTLAAFVRGPEGISVEYVEHKPNFSLT